MTFAASLISGVAALTLGARHLTGTATTPAFAHDVRITLGLVVACANAAALAMVLVNARRMDQSIDAVRHALDSLGLPPGAAPALVAEPHDEFDALQRPIQAARARIDLALSRAHMESDRNRAIIDTVFASVFAVDGGGRIISANPAAVRMFALPVGSLEGVVLSDLIEIGRAHV